VEAIGTDHLEALQLRDVNTGDVRTEPADACFIFIGTKPMTDWVELNVFKDEKGYLLTGRDLDREPRFKDVWPLGRQPYMLETCAPGIFAAGDVRSGAMNRVASAVGEGAMAIKMVHDYLAA